MVLFTAIWIFWNKSASHDLLKITVPSLLLINLPAHKSRNTFPHVSMSATARSWTCSTAPTKFQFSDHIRCSGHNRIRELILGGALSSLKRALRTAGLFILGVTMDTMLHWWCDKQWMSPNTPQAHHIRDRKVKMSDSYGQRKLFDEKPNCLAYVHNEIRAFFPIKKVYT